MKIPSGVVHSQYRIEQLKCGMDSNLRCRAFPNTNVKEILNSSLEVESYTYNKGAKKKLVYLQQNQM